MVSEQINQGTPWETISVNLVIDGQQCSPTSQAEEYSLEKALCWHRRDYFQQRGGEEQELRWWRRRSLHLVVERYLKITLINASKIPCPRNAATELPSSWKFFFPPLVHQASISPVRLSPNLSILQSPSSHIDLPEKKETAQTWEDPYSQ